MPDSSDVEAALAAQVTLALDGLAVRVYRGWPHAALLDADLAAGTSHVSVVGTTSWSSADRYLGVATAIQTAEPGLTATAAPGSVAFGGTAGAGQVAGVVLNGVGYAHRLLAADTPASVAAALAALVPGAAAQGVTLLAPGLGAVRIAADAAVASAVRRQQRRFQIAFWCPSPDLRDQLVARADLALASVPFLLFTDGTRGRLRAEGDAIADRAENAELWRRDLLYGVEYLTLAAETLPRMLFGTAVAALDAQVVLQLGDQALPAQVDTNGIDPLADGAGQALGEM